MVVSVGQISIIRIDLSMPLQWLPTGQLFWSPYFYASPLRAGDFIGSTAQGSPANFFNININPHGNGTHTECVGHIATESYFINLLSTLHSPESINQYLSSADGRWRQGYPYDTFGVFVEPVGEDALIIRTLPNGDEKRTRITVQYQSAIFECRCHALYHWKGIRHLLIDLPSVDREKMKVKLAHKAFWNYPGDAVRHDATITELIFVEILFKMDYIY